MKTYIISFMLTDGSWDYIEPFDADTDAEANEYAEERYGESPWYVLDEHGRNINGGDR